MTNFARAFAAASRVMARHDINIAISAPIVQIQELALAINLQGRYRIGAGLRGLDHLIEVSVFQRCGSLWATQRTMAAALPTIDSDQRQRDLAAQDLRGIVEVLCELIEEVPA